MSINNSSNISDINNEILNAGKEHFPEKRVVLGEGNINATILMIGEAPGGDEEKQGRPFVGKAGKNLDGFLKAIELERKDLYITNVVKIRPTGVSAKTGRPINRAPNNGELSVFTPFLIKEIEAVNPKIIVTLGNTPLKAVTADNSRTVGEEHGKILLTNSLKIFPLYHPAAIIYNTSLKEVYNNDLLNLKEILKSGKY